MDAMEAAVVLLVSFGRRMGGSFTVDGQLSSDLGRVGFGGQIVKEVEGDGGICGAGEGSPVQLGLNVQKQPRSRELRRRDCFEPALRGMVNGPERRTLNYIILPARIRKPTSAVLRLGVHQMSNSCRHLTKIHHEYVALSTLSDCLESTLFEAAVKPVRLLRDRCSPDKDAAPNGQPADQDMAINLLPTVPAGPTYTTKVVRELWFIEFLRIATASETP
ncbi:hypothetical protein SODALDRAFT_359056 [Sodiomyces alkalinus F11]|uniref:Uncharacterized protein n=1 Tax=Sodiomyces alkalinus (strain CBS 110278 / VKM F-3762 / F11) TaxID=1314773 RepID=A0A3N2PXC4_SODAK|nr:hypothetical protein SODALDRAFT_359056 [Sodiomyces alkalinus F11]ROT39183.1 hypothetical protein SODALDRAFT_359056 [Sodiomyces alkalinus F11]